MLVDSPLVEAKQNRSIRVEDLPKVVMGKKCSRLTEQRLVPLEATRHVADPYDCPRTLHWVALCGLRNFARFCTAQDTIDKGRDARLFSICSRESAVVEDIKSGHVIGEGR